MQCDICERHNRRLTCAQCAQGTVWPLRTEFLFKTAERDAASEKVQEHLESLGGAADATAARKEGIRERLERTRAESARLRKSISAERARVEKLRADNEARRWKLEQAHEATRNHDVQIEAIKGEIKRLNQRWKILYARTAEARSFLCREAAGLVDLRLKRRKSGKVQYMIGGVLIPNLLTDLNVHSHMSVNVALDHLAHLVVLVSHYLGLKLPNEIILSGRDTPFTSMRGLLNNRHMASRPLHAESHLATLARDNSTAHSKFIEGVSMLALDIAWLCYSQGLPVNEVEDASNIGHCLWKLLVAKDSTAATSASFGKTSHATINGYLASARFEPLMAGFKLRYNLIADRIRHTLQGETIVADWDMIPDAEKMERGTQRSSLEGEDGGVVVLPDDEPPEDGPSLPPPPPPPRPASSTSSGRGVTRKWTMLRARNDSEN